VIALAAMIAAGALSPSALDALPEAEAARRLLSGRRPRRIATAEGLLSWAAEATGTPAFLVAASLAASGDRAEVAALLLPPAEGTPPSLAEVVATLDSLAKADEAAKKAAWLALARRLPPEARHLLNRLAAGSFRLTLKPDAPAEGGPREFRALLSLLHPHGPEASFALRHGNGLVPIAKLRLTLPETPEIMAWARGNILDRFGPNLQVKPDLVFTLACEGSRPNARRKAGLDLVAPRLIAWNRDAPPDAADTLDAVRTPGFTV
jgi:hypothetical protein